MAFSYKNEHFQANRMLYGSCNAPAAFSRIMMRLMNHPSIILYLDDLVIIDSNWEEHLRSLEFVFKTCLEHGLILNSKKCQLASHELDFIGHRITAFGIKPLKKHLEAIENMKPPNDKSELKRFLGMVNFNVKFVRKLKPLKELRPSLIKDRKFCSTTPLKNSNEAVYGKQFHIPFTLKDPVEINVQPFIKSLNEYMKKLHPALLNFQVQRYQKLLKRDRNNCPVLDIGTAVLCWKPDLLAGKLGINWSGPYKIHRRLSKDSYILKCPLTKKEYRRHISLIRPLRRKLQGDTTELSQKMN
ncbi:unnamed protein product [Oikopleura dioica]|uniref:ribonuclease H n=1 Tax=Oikopleura dioica TaxID=34765 RepID=E4XYY3_OIKDI|nr:unnamed protein product [Oikopleura dioica]